MPSRYPALPFDLRSLEIFLAVCETGSMAQAARSLQLTQPAVSLAVAELERKTGATLFDRAVRPLALTLAGGLMRQRASALIADARQIAPMLREAKQGLVPLIRVGLVDSLSRMLTVPISSFLSERAGEVSILTGLTATHASELLTRRMDLFIGVDGLEELPGLERWELLVEPYVLLLRPSDGAVRTLGDLKKLAKSEPFIRYSARSQTGLHIDRHLRRLGIEA
ncbi:MAG TPA: LysR family transcriptional regulator, partial [Hyphomicrobium sp.]|nr:LysR family transcriptional regulator [Hyphomicrobium sp.]